jgi:KDO2-lipid IV(A) lauroyltransferase
MNPFFIFYRAFAWCVSRLPFSILYALSDILSFIFRYVLCYRKEVIRINLERSFPEKSPGELKKISGEFYHNLADVTMEIIKLQHISPVEMKDRFVFENHELLLESFRKNKSSIIAVGHCGNWEWMGTALGLVTPQKGYAIVKPLTSKDFNEYMQRLRHRLNPESTIPFRSAFRVMVRNRDHLSFNVIAGDQTPTKDEANFWITFLNQDTPFFQGIEKISRSLDMDVFFLDIRRTGRGRYCGHFTLITDSPRETADNEITVKYVRMLEEAIRNNPPNWLWSHRRWKHSRSA